MKSWAAAFNIYFVLVLVGLLSSAGCETTKHGSEHSTKDAAVDKEMTLFQIHLEASGADAMHSEKVPIYRESPVEITVEKSPLVDEVYLANASVIDSPAGFYIRVEYDTHGMMALENATMSHRGRRLAMHAQWSAENRWLAAPIIMQGIRNGVVTFTPDCTRGEADRIVTGINNLVKKLR